MASGEYNIGFKRKVLAELRLRNETERKPYEDIINLTKNLFESLDYHQKENVRLKVKASGFEQDVIELQNSESGSSKPTERLSAGKKLILLQEEFAELLKQKGELAQQVITQRNALDEREKEIAQKNAQISELEISFNSTQEVLKCLQQKLSEAENNFQFLKDEYDALLITFSSVEEKQKELERENEDLLSRFIDVKAEDADRLNEEAEFFQRLGKVLSSTAAKINSFRK